MDDVSYLNLVLLLFGNKLRLYKFTNWDLSFRGLSNLVILMKRRQVTNRLRLWSLWIWLRLVVIGIMNRPSIFKLPHLLVVMLKSYWLCWLGTLIIIWSSTAKQKSETWAWTSWSLWLHLSVVIKINYWTSAVTQVAIPIPSYYRVIVHSFDDNQ